MVSLSAYFDASGQQDADDPLVVAGLLATEKGWKRFEAQWESLLASNAGNFDWSKVTYPGLHRNEFQKVWKGSTEAEARLWKRAIAIISDNIPCIATLRLTPFDYHEVNQDYDLDNVWSGCYPIVAGGCMIHLRKEKEKLYGKQAIKYFIEHGDAGQDQFLKLLRLGAPEFDPVALRKYDRESGKAVRPFEAADLIAYEVALEWKRRGPERAHKMRRTLKEILNKTRLGVFEFPKSSLVEVAKDNPRDFPRRLPRLH